MGWGNDLTLPKLCLMDLSASIRAALLACLASCALVAFPAVADAGNGGVGPPGTDQCKKPGDGSGGDGSGDGGKPKASGASLRRLRTKPGKAFFDGRKPARFEFELRGSKRRNLIVTAARASDAAPVKTWRLNGVKPGAEPPVRWSGWTDDGKPAVQGLYDFVVTNANGTLADTSRAEGDGRVGFYGHKFPVRGEHTYGDGLGAKRGHQGFDIAAPCGTPLVAARGGRVQWRKFQAGGAGHYLVIDGRRTNLDYVYMHMRKRSHLAKGERVRTGELIGYVGTTGHSTGCHLHFEVWSAPGWGAGGDFLDAERMARAWDAWS